MVDCKWWWIQERHRRRRFVEEVVTGLVVGGLTLGFVALLFYVGSKTLGAGL